MGLAQRRRLAIAGLFAVLLATSRLPGIERIAHWPLGFFGNALVIHVIFSLVIWLLAMFAMVASFTTANLPHARLRAALARPVGQAFVALRSPACSPRRSQTEHFRANQLHPNDQTPDLRRRPLYCWPRHTQARCAHAAQRRPPDERIVRARDRDRRGRIIYIVAILCFGIAAIQLIGPICWTPPVNICSGAADISCNLSM